MSKLKLSRGYSEVRKRVSKGSDFVKSCYNCQFFYKGKGDTEELCQNEKVLRYDIVVTDTSIYCPYWEMYHRTPSIKKVMKKGLITDGKERDN